MTSKIGRSHLFERSEAAGRAQFGYMITLERECGRNKVYHPPTQPQKIYVLRSCFSKIVLETNQKFYKDFFCKMEGDFNFLAHF